MSLLSEANLSKDQLFFHGTKNQLQRLKSPTAERPFFVSGNLEYAYAYAYAGQVNGRTQFTIKQEKPGYVYIVELSDGINLFDALNNNDISKLARKYPKYIIESLKTKEWSIWSIFQHVNKILYTFYKHKFSNIDQLKKLLRNKNFNDQLGNTLLLNGIDQMLANYGSQYKSIYSSGNNEWQSLFQLISLFNTHIEELGFNAFINRENVSRVKEAANDIVTTRLAIGLMSIDCIKCGIPEPLSIPKVKQYIHKNNGKLGDIVSTKDKRQMSEAAKSIDFSKYEIVEFTGEDLEAILPHLRPLIKKSYEKIGGKQGERTVEQLKAVQTLAQVVYDKGKIIAYALAKKVHSNDVGNKLNLIGCDQTWKGKEALQAIIKYNIDNFKQHVWCECSGAIEHYFKKHGGYPIPNQLIPEIIGEPRGRVWFHEDGYHYRRFLAAAHGRFVQKIAFGFVNDDVMQKTLNKIGYDFMRDKINGAIHEDDTTALSKAESFVDELYKNYKDGTIGIMLPAISEFLDKAVEILEKNNSKFVEIGKKLQENLKPIKTGEIQK